MYRKKWDNVAEPEQDEIIDTIYQLVLKMSYIISFIVFILQTVILWNNSFELLQVAGMIMVIGLWSYGYNQNKNMNFFGSSILLGVSNLGMMSFDLFILNDYNVYFYLMNLFPLLFTWVGISLRYRTRLGVIYCFVSLGTAMVFIINQLNRFHLFGHSISYEALDETLFFVTLSAYIVILIWIIIRLFHDENITFNKLSSTIRGMDSLMFEGTLQPFQLTNIIGDPNSLTGYGIDEWKSHENGIIGMWKDILHPENKNVLEFMHQQLVKEKYSELTYKMNKIDGSDTWFHQKAMVDSDRKNTVQVVLIDITNVKNLEKKIVDTAKFNEVGLMASGIAHDFKNMITIIMGYTEILASELQATRHLRYIQKINQAARKGDELSTRLLQFGNKTGEKTEINLNELVESVIPIVGNIPSKNILIEQRLSPVNPIIGNRGQIEQVLINIISNSIDSIDVMGKISILIKEVILDETITVNYHDRSPGTYVMASIRDTGHGMDKQTVEKMFSPYFTTKQKGTGLGMSFVMSVIEQHKGIIEVNSEVDKGTQMNIYFPTQTINEKTQRANNENQVSSDKPLSHLN